MKNILNNKTIIPLHFTVWTPTRFTFLFIIKFYHILESVEKKKQHTKRKHAVICGNSTKEHVSFTNLLRKYDRIKKFFPVIFLFLIKKMMMVQLFYNSFFSFHFRFICSIRIKKFWIVVCIPCDKKKNNKKHVVIAFSFIFIK